MQPIVPRPEERRQVPVQQPQMPANTIAPQDMHRPEQVIKKKKSRFRRFARGYLMVVGLMTTFAALVYGLIVLLETFFPLKG